MSPTPAQTFMATFVPYYTYLLQNSPEALPSDALTHPDTRAMEQAVTRSGSAFFLPETMARFGTELMPVMYGERFFVTWDRNISDLGGFSVRWTYRYADGPRKIECSRFDAVFETEMAAGHFARQALDELFPDGD